MQKHHLFSLLALLALIALATKTGRMLNLYYSSAAEPAKIVTTDKQNMQAATTEYETAAIHHREVEKAIRRQLDADAVNKTSAAPTQDDLLYLAEVYSQMPAKDVVRTLEKMNNQQIIFILTSMNSEQASKIMIQMNLEKIREISQLMFAALTAKN